MAKRKSIPIATKVEVLTESGFRCAVPTCRSILAIDLHHLLEVSVGGNNDPSNLIALCPTCHALHHRGVIPQESLLVWKRLLASLMKAFDTQTIDDLLFLDLASDCPNEKNELVLNQNAIILTGDGVLRFSRLIASGLANYTVVTNNNWQIVTYTVYLTQGGKDLIAEWKAGNRKVLEKLGGLEIS